MITWDENIDADTDAKPYNIEKENIPTNFNEKKQHVKQKKFYILLAFLLITITLLIVCVKTLVTISRHK